jgi:hypothetical protein
MQLKDLEFHFEVMHVCRYAVHYTDNVPAVVAAALCRACMGNNLGLRCRTVWGSL